MASLAALWAEALSELPVGTPTAFAWIPRPPAVALDLAIQAAGLVSIPVIDSRQAAIRGATVWADPGGSAAPGGINVLSLPNSGGGSSPPGGEWLETGGGQEGGAPAGGAVVTVANGLQETSPADLVRAADRIQDAIAPGEGREIAVLGGSPEHWPHRALLAWATLHGAALLLAPTPDSLVSSAVWARPTLFLGTATELTALRRAVDRERPPFWDRRRNRLPFGRLRTILWTGVEELPPEQVDFWTSRGVLFLRCPPIA